MEPIILLVGLNHVSAPVRVREQVADLSCTRLETHAQLATDLNPPLFLEQIILSTCNRTEICVLTTDAPSAERQLRSLFAAQNEFEFAHADYLYSLEQRAAVAHLFAVTSGIDSLIVGEFEILGQVRRAYEEASARHSVGPILHQLFQHAIHVGKRARAETAIGQGAQSVAYAAVALARQQFGDLSGRTAVVVGAGEMGRRAAKNLIADAGCRVILVSRTHAHAAELARAVGAMAVTFEQVGEALAKADLVISATRAPHIIFDASAIAQAMQSRPARHLCLIDIAVPRDIDPAVRALPNVTLFNIDDLHALVDQTRTAREHAIVEVQALVQAQVEEFWQWYLTRRAAPVIGGLYTRADAIRQAELDHTLRRLSHLELNERERNILAAFSSSLVSKLLATPTAQLKARLASGDGQVYLDTLCELFQLSEPLYDCNPGTAQNKNF